MSELMRVLLWLRSGSGIPGGHVVQAEKTAEQLRALGVEVRVSTEDTLSPTDVTLVHGFGLSPEDIRHCRESGLRVCLSTVYCSRRWMLGLDQRMGTNRQIARRARLAVSLGHAGLRLRHVDKCEAMLERLTHLRLAFESADVLLPNSKMESEAIREELAVTTPMMVVPNGIDDSIFDPTDEPTGTRGETVVYVGRFEPHKNQLGLIRALRERPYKLILVGQTHPHHLGYLDQCRRAARGNVEFIGETSQERLASLYRRARVHALPSWYETTGLVSLEAAAMGCNIVTTNRGYAVEYFGDAASYCDPGDDRSITRAVDIAMHSTPDRTLRTRIFDQFTWRAAAEATLQAYERMAPQQGKGSP